jgi:photosystem II stability/assembly factor-like uncharacterized protein
MIPPRLRALFRVAAIAAALITTLQTSPPPTQAADGSSARARWEPLGLSGGGAMFTPAISPADKDLMLLNCDMSAAYVSEDGGRTWRMIHHRQLRSDIRCRPAFHPADPNIVYASSGGQLRVSRDRARTFTQIGNLKESLQGEIAICPTQPQLMLTGVAGGRCFLTRDAGVTWRQCTGPVGDVLGFHFERGGQRQIIYAATRKGIWRSSDGGESWSDKTGDLPSGKIQAFAGGSSPAGEVTRLYCAVESRVRDGRLEGGIYRSHDHGESWERAMGSGINEDTRKADQWAYGDVAQYERLFTTDVRPSTVYAMNTSTGFQPPHHETVFRSDDAGQTWRETFFVDPRFKPCNVAPDWVTGSTGRTFKGGEAPFGAGICNTDADRLILVRNEVHVTHDGGRTWFAGHTYPAREKPAPGSSWTCNGLVVTTTWHFYQDPFESNRQYIAYTDIGLARSLDSGQSWIWWNDKSWAPWRNTCYELAFDPEVSGKVWGAFSDVHDIPNDNIISERHGHSGPGGVCVSHDFAATWKHEAKGLPLRPVTSIILDPKSPKGARTLYAGVFEEGVFKSSDDGKNWAPTGPGLGHDSNRRVSRVALHTDGTLFAMVCAKRPGRGQPLSPEGVGLYRSRNGGERWELVNASKRFLYPKDFSVDSSNSQRILIGACDAGRGDESGGLYLTDDGGSSWRRIGRKGSQTFGGYFHPQHPDWMYMTLTEGAPGAGLWFSQDNGQSWQAFDELPFSNIQRVHFNAQQPGTIHVTTFGGSVWRGPARP